MALKKNCVKMRVKSWTRMMEEADEMGAKRKIIPGEIFCMHWSIKRESEIMAAISYSRGVLVEGIQEGYKCGEQQPGGCLGVVC